jgi:hypothetical protein
MTSVTHLHIIKVLLLSLSCQLVIVLQHLLAGTLKLHAAQHRDCQEAF